MDILKETTINQILSAYPETSRFFNNLEMSCGQCFAGNFETLEKGALMHGMDVSKLMGDLRQFIQDLPSAVSPGSET